MNKMIYLIIIMGVLISFSTVNAAGIREISINEEGISGKAKGVSTTKVSLWTLIKAKISYLIPYTLNDIKRSLLQLSDGKLIVMKGLFLSLAALILGTFAVVFYKLLMKSIHQCMNGNFFKPLRRKS